MSTRSGAPTLVLFPTELEQRRFHDLGGLPCGFGLEAVCGFGPVAAAARTTQLCERLRPARLLLLGIAGTYDGERLPVGTAIPFGRVTLDGVGVGQGPGHLGPTALGFPQLPGDEPAASDSLDLEAPPEHAESLLLTTAAASADAGESAMRQQRFPDALAEDMEGHAVALAGFVTGTPVSIVRGFSNVVGDRDAANWRIQNALSAARRVALELLEEVR